jgi:WD40 repeat protein
MIGQILTGVMSIQFSPDGFLVIGHASGIVEFWDIDRKRLDGQLLCFENHPLAIRFSKQGGIMAIEVCHPSENGQGVRVYLYSYPERRQLAQFDGMEEGTCQLSQDGSILIMKPLEQDIALYKVGADKIPRKIGNIDGTWKNVQAVALSPNGSVFACLTRDNGLTIWDVKKKEVRRTLVPRRGTADPSPTDIVARPRARHHDDIVQILFTPDGRYLLTMRNTSRRTPSFDFWNSIYYWETTNWERVSGKTLSYGEGLGGSTMAVSPDSSVLAVAGFTVGDSDKTARAEGLIALIDVPTGRVLRWCKFTGWDGYFAKNMVFSPDGKRIASGEEHRVGLWSVTDRRDGIEVVAKPGIGEQKQDLETVMRYECPEAVFWTYWRAYFRGDARKLFSLRTETRRNSIVFDAYFKCRENQDAETTRGHRAAAAAIGQIVGKYVDAATLEDDYQKQYKEKHGMDLKELRVDHQNNKKPATLARHDDPLWRDIVAAHVKDKAGFVEAVAKYFQKRDPKQSDYYAITPLGGLEQLVVEGDTAKGRAKFTYPAIYDEPFVFRRVNGGWLIDSP